MSPRRGAEVVRARARDVDAIPSVLKKAARWLASRDVDQWRPGTFSRQSVADRIERDEVYLAVLNGRPAGSFVLRWSDEEAWGDAAGDAGYVHALAIRREASGRGLGREMLRWAEGRAAAAGKQYLRLDCAAENRALNGYYRRAGFRRRGRASVSGLEVSLYEKYADAASPR